jgi:hypothetical protein
MSRFELKSNAVYVEVPQVTSNSTAETQLVLNADDANTLVIGKTGNSLVLRHRVNGVNNDTYVAYNATTMRWWQISESGGTISFQTSPDRTTWTTQRTVTKAFDLSQLKVVLQAGTWQAVAAPGSAQFDNLNNVPAANTAVTLDGTAAGQAVLSGGAQTNAAYQTLTIEAWAKAQATGIYGGEIVSNGNNYGLRILPDGNVRFFIHTGNLIWKNYDTTGVNIKNNAWHHVAATKDGTTVNIYIDGVLSKSFASTEPISYTLGKDIVVGRNGAGDNNFNLTGSVDELRIWNVVRSASAIQANRLSEIAAQPNLTYYWRFNDNIGTNAADVSGGGHPMTLGAGASWSAGFPMQ